MGIADGRRRFPNLAFFRRQPGLDSLFHKDPFDRMLIAQALMGGLAIATSDRAFEPYPVRVIW